MSMFEKRRGNEAVDEGDTVGATPPNPVPRKMAVTSRDTATIGKTITIKGDVVGEESLIIGGKVDGTVLVKGHDLTVAPSGLVTASVKASVVRIEGEVTGDIDGTEKVVLAKSGRVRGNIVAPRVTLEDGAKFKGSIDMDPGPIQETATHGAPRAAPAAISERPREQVAQASSGD